MVSGLGISRLGLNCVPMQFLGVQVLYSAGTWTRRSNVFRLFRLWGSGEIVQTGHGVRSI